VRKKRSPNNKPAWKVEVRSNRREQREGSVRAAPRGGSRPMGCRNKKGYHASIMKRVPINRQSGIGAGREETGSVGRSRIGNALGAA